jgi:hypothetical protein
VTVQLATGVFGVTTGIASGCGECISCGAARRSCACGYPDRGRPLFTPQVVATQLLPGRCSRNSTCTPSWWLESRVSKGRGTCCRS